MLSDYRFALLGRYFHEHFDLPMFSSYWKSVERDNGIVVTGRRTALFQDDPFEHIPKLCVEMAKRSLRSFDDADLDNVFAKYGELIRDCLLRGPMPSFLMQHPCLFLYEGFGGLEFIYIVKRDMVFVEHRLIEAKLTAVELLMRFKLCKPQLRDSARLTWETVQNRQNRAKHDAEDLRKRAVKQFDDAIDCLDVLSAQLQIAAALLYKGVPVPTPASDWNEQNLSKSWCITLSEPCEDFLAHV